MLSRSGLFPSLLLSTAHESNDRSVIRLKAFFIGIDVSPCLSFLTRSHGIFFFSYGK
jgi:hypothetical protein